MKCLSERSQTIKLLGPAQDKLSFNDTVLFSVTAQDYIENIEFPDLFKLRIEMLVEGGVDTYALNLCNWCVKNPAFENDTFIWQTQLLLLHKFGRKQDFYNQV